MNRRRLLLGLTCSPACVLAVPAPTMQATVAKVGAVSHAEILTSGYKPTDIYQLVRWINDAVADGAVVKISAKELSGE